MPDQAALRTALMDTFQFWNSIENFTNSEYVCAVGEWHFSSAKFGWSYRIKDKKRTIVYLLPRDNFFKVAMVFGNKAYEEILKSPVSESIKTELENARVYAEGRGIRITISDDSLLKDIRILIKIKISI